MVAFPQKTWADGSAGGTPLSAAALNDLETRIDNAFALAGTGSGSGGAVDSVNGETGVVVLTAADVDARPDDYTPSVSDLPANMVMFAIWSDSVKQSRPTSRTDVKVFWFTSGSTLPAIVSSGTGGMLNNVDVQIPL